jgi:hypothetical protein
LRQSNHELASRWLTIAAGVVARGPDADAWAARVLSLSQQRGLTGERLDMLGADMAALARRLDPEAAGNERDAPQPHIGVSHLRSLADTLDRAVAARPSGSGPASAKPPSALRVDTAQIRLRAQTLQVLQRAARPHGVLRAQPALSPAETRWLMHYSLNGGDDAAASASIRQEGAGTTAGRLLVRLGLPDLGALQARLNEVPGLRTPPAFAQTATRPDAVPLRAEPAARATYNNPPHWISTADGTLVPDAARLQGHSARLWAALGQEFGVPLAQQMFNAQVRGGAVAVIAARNASGGMKRLGTDDLAALHFVAITDGGAALGVPAITLPAPERPHDEEHAFTGFGVSWVQEAYNSCVLDALTDLNQAVDTSQPLRQQPRTVAELRVRLDRGLAELEFESYLRVHVDRTSLKGTSAAAAAGVERDLEDEGYLAHLNPSQREQLRAMLYGSQSHPRQAAAVRRGSVSPTLQTIAVRFAARGDEAECDRSLAAWSRRATGLLVSAAEASRLPTEALRQSAARLFAYKLCMARHPNADLRVEYPTVLREVQEAFGLP